MIFTTARNQLIAALAEFLGCPVILSDQVEPEQDPPYVIYSVLSPYGQSQSLGDYSLRPEDDRLIETRMEQPEAVFSFTACSINRMAKGKGKQTYIFGEDEALSFSNLAQGWLLHTGYDTISRIGFVVVEIMNAGSRTTLVIDEAARRFGFDARLRYTRTDERAVGTVETVPIKKQKE